MAIHFHKTPIVLSATTLKILVDWYSDHTAVVDFPTIDEEAYEKWVNHSLLTKRGKAVQRGARKAQNFLQRSQRRIQ